MRLRGLLSGYLASRASLSTRRDELQVLLYALACGCHLDHDGLWSAGPEASDLVPVDDHHENLDMNLPGVDELLCGAWAFLEEHLEDYDELLHPDLDDVYVIVAGLVDPPLRSEHERACSAQHSEPYLAVSAEVDHGVVSSDVSGAPPYLWGLHLWYCV